MSDNENGSDEQQSQLIATFSSIGSADFSSQMQNVRPAQMLALASWLEWYAKKMFDAELENKMQQQAARQIQMPPGIDLKKGPPHA